MTMGAAGYNSGIAKGFLITTFYHSKKTCSHTNEDHRKYAQPAKKTYEKDSAPECARVSRLPAQTKN